MNEAKWEAVSGRDASPKLSFRQFLFGVARRVKSRFALILSGLLMALFEPLSLFSLGPFLSFAFDTESIRDHFLYLLAVEYGFVATESEFFIGFGVFTIFSLVTLNALILFHSWASARFCYGVGVAVSAEILTAHLSSRNSSFPNLQPNSVVKNVMAETTRAVEWFIQPAVQAVFRSFSLLLMSLALLIYSPTVAPFVFLTVTGVYALIYFLLSDWLRILGERVSDLIREKQAVVSNVAFHRDDLLSLDLTDRVLSDFWRIADDDAALKAKSALFSFLPKLVIEGVCLALVCLLVLLFTDLSSKESVITLDVAAVFGLFVYRALPAAQGIYYGVSRARFNLKACQELFDSLVLYNKLTGSPRGNTVEMAPTDEAQSKSSGVVDFEVSSITYSVPGPEMKALLTNLSFRGSGSFITAITGPSGSGKTTLLRLLAGIEKPDFGEIKIIGAENSLSRSDLSVVFQAPTVFDGSVGFNIALESIDGIDDSERDFVAKLLQMVELNHGGLNDLSLVIGRGGRELSGGEAQRLCLARALYRKPKILLLDEATSALDEALEGRLMSHLKEYVQENRIKVYMIAHRRSAINFADDRLDISK